MVVPTRPRPAGTRPVLVMLALALLVTLGAGPATAAPNSGRAPRYYLALGDSLSRGVQPDPGGQNHPTDQGYADDLAKVARLVLPQLQLVKRGCETEETTASMINGGRCTYPNGPAPDGAQLAEAEAFLRAHRGSTVLVTLDIGANDLSRCINRASGAIDLACVQATFAQVPGNLGTILERLRAAAGPRVLIVGMNYPNPFLASWLQGPAGQALARLSTGPAEAPRPTEMPPAAGDVPDVSAETVRAVIRARRLRSVLQARSTSLASSRGAERKRSRGWRCRAWRSSQPASITPTFRRRRHRSGPGGGACSVSDASSGPRASAGRRIPATRGPRRRSSRRTPTRTATAATRSATSAASGSCASTPPRARRA